MKLKYKNEFGTENVTLVVEGLYIKTGYPMIEMYGEDGEPYTSLTTNITNEPVLPGCVFIDQNFKKEKIRFIEENNLGKFIGYVLQGFTTFPCVKLNIKKLKDVVEYGKEFLDEWEECKKAS